MRNALLQILVASGAIALALAMGGIVILIQGHDPIEVYGVLLQETLREPMGIGQVLFKTTTLIFTGLAAAFAFRAGLFNIGGEGQLYLGAFTGALAGLWLPSGTPAAVAVPVILLAAFAGGAAAAAPPAILKATRGTHEVINTMMMNFILLAVVHYALGSVRVPETVRTRAILPAGRVPLLSSFVDSMRGSDANLTIAIAILFCFAVFYLFGRTRLGYELRAVGWSPKAAEYGGVPIRRTLMLSLLLSGGLAGLGGANFVMGSPGYFEQGFAPNQGYLGIAVALLARNHPISVIPAAFLFALLAEGGQSIQRFVPKEMGNILQAVVILFVVVGAKGLERALLALQKRRTAHA